MTQADEKATMHRRKQTPKEDIEKTFAATPVVTFALLSVSLTDASGTNWLSKLVCAARSKSEQQKLWGMAELFFQQSLGCIGRLIRVHGDLQPEGSYLILAPRVQLLPNMLVAARNLLIACASFTTLQVQLQIGRSAVFDHLGKLHGLVLFCSAVKKVLLVCSPESSLTDEHCVAYAGMSFIAPSPFFDAKWTQHRNGSECTQLFAKLAPPYATMHALISRADFSAEAMKLSLRAGPDLEQVLAQVTQANVANVANVLQCACSPKFYFSCAETIHACFQVNNKPGLNADADLPLEQCTAGCTMLVPTDGMVFMILITVSVRASNKILYNLVTQMDD